MQRSATVSTRRLIDFEVVEQFADRAAFGVVADHGGQDRLRVQGGEHRGHAARPAQPMLLPADAEDGNRRLGADPLHVAPQVAIQHHVAHQQDPRGETGRFEAIRSEIVDIRVLEVPCVQLMNP